VPEDAKVIAHVFLSVLIAGTLWNLVKWHLLASPQVQLNHLGTGMAAQY
jgi:hypothetical protein